MTVKKKLVLIAFFSFSHLTLHFYLCRSKPVTHSMCSLPLKVEDMLCKGLKGQKILKNVKMLFAIFPLILSQVYSGVFLHLHEMSGHHCFDDQNVLTFHHCFDGKCTYLIKFFLNF